MTIDSRAWVWCNLGDLADEASSITEDHAQRVGVIMYRGTINLKGSLRPVPGAIVELAYSDGQNWIARLPLRLRVLSSFCNALLDIPVTSVSVGCDLAYLNDRKQPPASLPTKPANPGFPDAVWRAAAPATPASWLVGQILAALGLAAASSIPLTNHMLIDEFNMTAGYVAELDKLCSSEGYAARMNESGQVEFIYKGPVLTVGPLITRDDLIDFNPINTGELPGEAVYAKYTSTILSAPKADLPENELQKRNWERESSSSAAVYTHTWTEHSRVGTGQYQQRRNAYGYPLFFSINGAPVLDEIETIQAVEREEEIDYLQSSISITNYDKKDRVVSRITSNTDQWGPSRTEVYYEYRDGFVGGSYSPTSVNENDNGEISSETTVEYSPLASVRQSLGQQATYQTLYNSGTYQSLRREVFYTKNKATGITRTITKEWAPFMNTTDGAEVISRLRERKKPYDSVDDLIEIATRLVQKPIEERIRTEREFGIQRRPKEAERSLSANIKTPAVEQQESITWLFGSAASQTSIELSPPYVSDDRVVYSPPGPNDPMGVPNPPAKFTLVPSDASTKALNYARLENALLFGHRNGNGIQLLPENLPIKPLSFIYIRLQNCTAAFLANGRTWNVSPQGVTCTADAVFHSAVDGTSVNSAWFPLPPNTTSLPELAPVTTNASPKPANAVAIPQGFNHLSPGNIFATLPKGQEPVFAATIQPSSGLLPYTETLSLFAGIGVGAIADPEDWIAPPPASLFAGAGVGAIYQEYFLDSLFAGVGVGAIANGLEVGYTLMAGVGVGIFAVGALIEEPSGDTYSFVTIVDTFYSFTIGDLTISAIEDFTFGSLVTTGGNLVVLQSGNIYTLEWNMPTPVIDQDPNLNFAYDVAIAGGKVLTSFSQSVVLTGGSITDDQTGNYGSAAEPYIVVGLVISSPHGATKLTHTLQIA